ncbi:gamma-glutamylcyclotransferase [Amylibacter sp. SFDW26]|uniref:gamma-glutamylcyclotransferase n=1 Tax=Amylibacter sp. SFDW26 TaxID=2652722 RepID=UPI001261580B|nr:gamma-glutamylcyclotransferase [Amylibacter sp. SFDW26]KAB7610467.1 gamma-glutamylcyclotransferase [Amylibacter sp. SFDW26]
MVENGFWVFGYGSLIWQPEFIYAKKHIATLQGYARSFCMLSIHHRGSEESPGLVLALDENDQATCEGVAFFIEAEHATKAIKDLRERELVSSAYIEVTLPVKLQTGEEVKAVSYVINRDNVQYCGGMPLEEQAQIIARAVGGRGPNTEYLYNTCDCLNGLGLDDADLAFLESRVKALTA